MTSSLSFSSFVGYFVILMMVLKSGGLYVNGCYTSIISFGDSLADTGSQKELSHISHQLYPCLYSPYGETFFHKPTGRCSNGRLIIDFLAESLGLPMIQPFLHNKHKIENRAVALRQGVNYAVAGATALDSSFLEAKWPERTVINASLEVQLTWFKQSLPSICGNTSDCKSFIKSSLILMGEIGGNDYSFPLLAGKSVDEVKPYVPLVTDMIISTVNELIEMGAQTLVVPGNFPIGCSSSYLTTRASASEEYDPITGCLVMLQKKLNMIRELHPNVNLIYADYYNAALQFYRSPNAFGFTSGALKACCGAGGPFNYNLTVRCGDESATMLLAVVCFTTKYHMDNLRMMKQEPVKLDRFDGCTYTRWANKMKFLLSVLKVYYVLDPTLAPIPCNPIAAPGQPVDEKKVAELEKMRMIHKEDETICCGHNKNTLSDTLYDLYALVTNPRELWSALEFNSSEQKSLNGPKTKDCSLDDLLKHLRMEEEAKIRDKRVKENPRKGQNQIKTEQKREAWQSQKKSEAVTVDRGRKTKQNAKKKGYFLYAQPTFDLRKEMDERSKLMLFLMKLNDEFESVRNQILSIDLLPNINKAYYIVQKQKQVTHQYMQKDTPFQMDYETETVYGKLDLDQKLVNVVCWEMMKMFKRKGVDCSSNMASTSKPHAKQLEALVQEEPAVLNPRRSTRSSTKPSWLKDFVTPRAAMDYYLPNTKQPLYLLFHSQDLDNFLQEYVSSLANVLNATEPTSYRQVGSNTQWVEAMNKELNALEETDTWELTFLPPNQKRRYRL
nr:SGNH hydrolase-type esterase domain-containing protein [Tanacetum cinerariifolium]